MKKLEKLIQALESYIPQAEKINNNVSNVNVGWHIEHSLLVIISIAQTILNSDASKYKWKWSTKKVIVFLVGSFPRGKANAPEIVMPKNIANAESLAQQIKAARNSIQLLKNAGAKQYFTHPIFGMLDRDATIPFLGIHTNHHLKIIKDILA